MAQPRCAALGPPACVRIAQGRRSGTAEVFIHHVVSRPWCAYSNAPASHTRRRRLRRGAPLGTGQDNWRVLSPGSTLLLYADGLIERPGHDIDTAIATLVAVLARHGDGPLPDLVRRISMRLADPHPADDVVVLAVRVP